MRTGERDPFLSEWKQLEECYLRRMAVVTAPYEKWRDRFHAAATETARLVEAHPAEARLVAVDALAKKVGRESQAAFAARLVEHLDSARDELDNPDSIPAATAPWIIGIFFDRVYRRCATGAPPDLLSQLPELMFLAISAYFGTEAGLKELV